MYMDTYNIYYILFKYICSCTICLFFVYIKTTACKQTIPCPLFQENACLEIISCQPDVFAVYSTDLVFGIISGLFHMACDDTWHNRP